MNKKSFLCANWKMNLPAQEIDAFVEALTGFSSTEVAVAPPYPFLHDVQAAIRAHESEVRLAAQNCAEHASGAFTGEVSVSMLKRCGAELVIIGHSERRAIYGETNAIVGRKLNRALSEGVAPIFCVGEDQETRDSGATDALLAQQLRQAFDEVGEAPPALIIAYEPVWAIGTGRNATPEIAADAHRTIRDTMRSIAPDCTIRVLYGGSVTPDSAGSLAEQEEVEGFLVGGASLDANRFRSILEALERKTALRG